MAKKTIQDLDVAGKRVLVRVDFNVPLDDEGKITDDTRIRAALPTIEYLSGQGARVVLMSHLGRPKGERKPEFSLKPAAERLGELITAKVTFADDCVGPVAEEAVAALSDGDVLLLENVRFYAEETKNDTVFAEKLAKNGDIYVNDAFGTAHRAHASTAGVAAFIPDSGLGYLMQKELQYLQDELEDPARPFVVIMGGAKVSDKIGVMTRLMDKGDVFLVGGAMANTFRLAQGYEQGNSMVEADKTDVALEILEKADELDCRVVLPIDTRYAEKFEDDAPTACTEPWGEGGAIPEGHMGIDIGDRAIEQFAKEIANAGTVVWNGPVGVFEKRGFDIGTRAVADALASSPAKKIVGGGDSVTAVNQFGVADKMDHISTGGGASLELLEGKELPGVAALADKA